MDKTKDASNGVVADAGESKGSAKPDSAPIKAAKTKDQVDGLIDKVKSLVVAPKVVNIPYTVAPVQKSTLMTLNGHPIVRKNESNCKKCGACSLPKMAD